MSGNNRFEQIEQLIVAEILALYERASEIADESWALTVEAQKTLKIQEWAKFRVRVRQKPNTISIEWNRVRFVGPKGKRKPISQYVARGRGYKYSKSSFSEAPAWERDAIAEFEEEFGRIRQQAERLVTLKRDIRRCAKADVLNMHSSRGTSSEDEED